jgi:hypothetical protein
MKYYKYVQPGEDGVTPEWFILSEEQILDNYWLYYKLQMAKVEKEDLISKENCIENWVIIHWAWEVDKDGNPIQT